MNLLSKYSIFTTVENNPTTTSSFKQSVLPLQALHKKGLMHQYLAEANELASFITAFPSTDSLAQQLEKKQITFKHRAVLTEAITNQYANLEVTEAVSHNIKALGKNGFAITTAHQPNLFGGPLYWVYKALSTIKLANMCSAAWGKPIVPIFWLGSEDHDFDELNHIRLFNKKIDWNDRQGGAFGKYNTASLGPVIAEVNSYLGSGQNGQKIKAIIEEAYSLLTITAASRYLLNALFGAYGLVVVDGDDASLKSLMHTVFKDDLIPHKPKSLISPKIDELETLYGRSQAYARDINLFYLEDNRRERITKVDGKYKVGNASLSEEELLELLKNEPQKFSPNVMLRPLMQEMVLPNLAYVGGGGELSYWFQLKGFFDGYETPFPILIRRDSALVVDAKTQKRVLKTGIAAEQFLGDIDAIKKEFVMQHSKNNLHLEAEGASILSEFDTILKKAIAIDSTLSQPVQGERQKLVNSLKKLEKKMLRAEKRNFGEQMQRIDAIKEAFYPMGNLQERSINFMQFYSQYGPAFFDALLEAFNPLEYTIKVLEEK